MEQVQMGALRYQLFGMDPVNPCFFNRFSQTIQLTLCSVAALIVCLLIWFDVWDKADVVRTGNTPELIVSTLTAIFGLLTSMIGWAGILLNNRSYLAWYTFMTWMTFAFLVTPGYITYKRRTFNLEGKINAQWSRDLDAESRLRIQNQLNCCGYFSPFVEATVSQTCYARSLLPGCKGPYLNFERSLLLLWYKVVFALVPAQIMIMVAGLLCSNHISYRFGKGMMPEAYRLNMNSMAVIMDNYAEYLAFLCSLVYFHSVLITHIVNLQISTEPILQILSSNVTVRKHYVIALSTQGLPIILVAATFRYILLNPNIVSKVVHSTMLTRFRIWRYEVS